MNHLNDYNDSDGEAMMEKLRYLDHLEIQIFMA